MSHVIAAVVTGTVLALEATAGEIVPAGTPLLLIESMKMEIPVCAAMAGRVGQFLVAPGELVQEGQSICTFIPD